MVFLDWYDSVREDGLLEFWASCLAPAGMPENDPASENGSDSSPNQPTLYGIPVEVMQQIASYLEDPKDFYALIRTNRWIYAAVHPALYDIDTDFDCDSMFWTSSHGVLETLALAYDAGADLDMRGPIYYHPKIGEPLTDRSTYIAANGTPLHYAAKGGHVHVAQWLIDHDADVKALSHGICNCGYEYEPDVEDYHEDTPQWIPLHTALCYGQLNVAMLLIDHGSSLDMREPGNNRRSRRDSIHQHALHLAAERCFLSIIDRLVSTPTFNVNLLDGYGRNALHYTAVAPDAGRQSLEIHHTIDRLLSLGAAINAVDNAGMTPLATAILAGNYSTALKFLSLGANPDHRPNQPGASGYRPLYLSVQYRDKSRKKIYLWPNKKHRGRFHEFSDPRHNRRRDKRNIKLLIEALVSAGAKIDALFDSPNRDRRWPPHNDLMTALGRACKKKNFAAVAALVKCGANVNVQGSRDGRTPFYYSMPQTSRPEELDSVQIACFLFKHGARVTFQDTCFLARIPVKLLRQILKATNKDSISHSNLENLIKKETKHSTHLKYIVEKNHVVLFELLRNKRHLKPIPNGEDVRHPQVLADTSTVWYATEDLLARSMLSGSECLSETLSARYTSGEVLKVLLRYGANPTIRPPDSLFEELYPANHELRRHMQQKYQSPLELAICRRKFFLATQMLSESAGFLPPIEIATGVKQSCIHYSCQLEDNAMLKLLLSKGADPNGGKGCLDPPAAMIPRNLWEKVESGYKIDLAVENLGLLLGLTIDQNPWNGQYAEKLTELTLMTPVYELLLKVCGYNGEDTYYVSLRDLMRVDLGITAVEDKLVCERPHGRILPVNHRSVVVHTGTFRPESDEGHGGRSSYSWAA
ncbi:Ankyrin repeat-containing domain protein [Rhypophila decipiens]